MRVDTAQHSPMTGVSRSKHICPGHGQNNAKQQPKRQRGEAVGI